MTTTRLAIHGAAGRMGQRLVALGAADSALTIAAALESDGHPELGRDAGTVAGDKPLGVALSSLLDVPVDAVIDFSVPAAAEKVTQLCQSRKLPLVIATTGLSAQQQEQVRAAAGEIAIVWAPNMSLATNVAMKLCTVAAAALKNNPQGVDVEIIERHHRHKVDAPSGTALRFGELIAGVLGTSKSVHGRQGHTGERSRDEIGYHALRVGDDPGQHTIVFGMPGETLEVTVRATSRDSYALGALAAAKFVAGKSPGLYNMNDVLGL